MLSIDHEPRKFWVMANISKEKDTVDVEDFYVNAYDEMDAVYKVKDICEKHNWNFLGALETPIPC